MKLAVSALLIGSAAAFAPAAQQTSTSALMASPYENELGVINPTGFWDPFDLSGGASPETFAQYRAAELKHGRVAQLAVVGYVVQECYRFPGEISPGLAFADVPNGIAAVNAIPSLGWAQIILDRSCRLLGIPRGLRSW